MTNFVRSHHCGELNLRHLNEQVTLSGWVHRYRDHGGLIFVDLRDRFGLTQLVFDPEFSKQTHMQAEKLRNEWVISIKGTVTARGEGLQNPKIPTGDIEVQVMELHILSIAHTPPFQIADENDVSEELRLHYRYLDIRRGKVADLLALRHKVMMTTRNFMDAHGFLEISTPILAKSTPEGARDYLVPSRITPGHFYALPQSPQIFKQLLMMSGMDRYFQIAACFRDEDLRADRQPEFTQIDLEMSFSTPSELMPLLENLLKTIFKQCVGKEISSTFPKMSYKDCLESYGTDRPDLRFGMPLIRIDDIAMRSEFSVFRQELEQGGIVKAICVKNASSISRKDIEHYTDFVKKFGLGGLAWMKMSSEGLSSSIVKFFSSKLLKEIETKLEAEPEDLILFGAGPEERVNQALDHLRRTLAKNLQLIPEDELKFLWVVDFPLFRYDNEAQRLESEHHPFTSPRFEDIPLLEKDPLKIKALAYDLVLNGYEIGGGSQRIHDARLQEQIFRCLKLTEQDIQEKFGFFVEALKFGTPPHLGFAFGLDRLVMILGKTDNIRDVIAFPKTQKAFDLLLGCPSAVRQEQLDELKLKIDLDRIL